MAKIVFGIIAVLASLMLVEALVCNKCDYALNSYCMNSSNETCSNDTYQCGGTKVSFTSFTKVGFYSKGCMAPSLCNATTNGSLILAYEKKTECCSTDNCNTLLLSGAPSTKMTLTAATGVAVLASMWGSLL